jgi:hypothetical protein
MGIFGKKKREELPADVRTAADAMADEQLEDQPANYSTVLDWLLGLSEKDYKKMGTVVDIYRKANADTAKALGIKTEPTSFLPHADNTEAVPQDVNHLSPNSAPDTKADEAAIDDFLNDELDSAFLADDEPKKPASEPVKVEVKDGDKAKG